MFDIVPPAEGQKPNTWSILELQGSLETKTTDLSTTSLGTVVLRPTDGKPILELTTSRVGGVAKKLGTPLVVLHGVDRVGIDGSVRKVYVAKAVIRDSLLFTDRPQPIVGGAAKKTS